MKFGPVTKIDKRNTATSKKIDQDIMLASCDIIFIFPISGQFGAIRKTDYRRVISKTYIFSNSNLLSYKK